ncbi:MAG TPA: alpha/beta hydrolase [Steroidobacteraceae bacterium]|nr:alpha/beta hydrolase [Steroidobacteraceae bacterium]
MESKPSIEDIRRRRVVYSVPGMAEVRKREAQPYKSTAGSPLCFDLYTPNHAPERCPAVILVHGGPIPVLGARRAGVFVSYGELLAASGMVGIAFDHRYLESDAVPVAAADLADLISHIREHATSLGIDENRLAVWAFSGGGLLLATVLRERPSWCRLVIAYYALMEPINAAHDGMHSAIAALGRDAADDPAILVARAGRDDPQINATLDRFVSAAIEAGATVDLLTHPTGHHGFDIFDSDERSRQIIRRTLDALRSSLGV